MYLFSFFVLLSMVSGNVSSSHRNCGGDITGLCTQDYQFGPNVRQRYDVYIPCGQDDDSDTKPEKVWLVYIHGGFFRQLSINSTSVEASVKALESGSPELFRTKVAGIASLDYRLSAQPGVQNPAITPLDELQNARWPDHLDDVLEGLRDLERRYRIHCRYVLSGHSVGAQMSFIAALRTLEDRSVPMPLAVLGVSGIYDFPQIHRTNPEYLNLTSNAMDRKFFGPASPAEHAPSAYSNLHLKAAVLAHSHDDGLVPWDQVETMESVLQQVSNLSGRLRIMTLHGQHNSIWSEGQQLADSFREILSML